MQQLHYTEACALYRCLHPEQLSVPTQLRQTQVRSAPELLQKEEMPSLVSFLSLRYGSDQLYLCDIEGGVMLC